MHQYCIFTQADLLSFMKLVVASVLAAKTEGTPAPAGAAYVAGIAGPPAVA
jgi:hypothetical protein